jgi:hypothetical protein
MKRSKKTIPAFLFYRPWQNFPEFSGLNPGMFLTGYNKEEQDPHATATPNTRQ